MSKSASLANSDTQSWNQLWAIKSQHSIADGMSMLALNVGYGWHITASLSSAYVSQTYLIHIENSPHLRIALQRLWLASYLEKLQEEVLYDGGQTLPI